MHGVFGMRGTGAPWSQKTLKCLLQAPEEGEDGRRELCIRTAGLAGVLCSCCG